MRTKITTRTESKAVMLIIISLFYLGHVDSCTHQAVITGRSQQSQPSIDSSLDSASPLLYLANTACGHAFKASIVSDSG